MKLLLCLILSTGIATTALFALQAHLTQEEYDTSLIHKCTSQGFYEARSYVLRCSLIEWNKIYD